MLVRNCDRHASQATDGWGFVDTAAALMATAPTIIVEAAGHEAVRVYAEGFLRAGLDFLAVSGGVIADDALLHRLRRAAGDGQSRLLLASGAVGSLDALSAARALGLQEVIHTIRKPISALSVTTAATSTTENGDLVLFSGTAREAALAFPVNANVVVAVGFAGVGLDLTTVRILASRTSDRNVHEIRAVGTFGELEFRVANRSSPANPRSSLLAAGSLAAALVKHSAAVSLA